MFERRSGRLWCESWLGSGSGRLGGLEEPANSISSLWIGGITLASLLINTDYIHRRPSALFVFAAVAVISLSSTYYHATLSLFGQLVDELSLVWATIAGWVVWLPGSSEEFKATRRNHLRAGILCLGIIYTLILLTIPKFNAVFLMFSLSWIYAMVRREMRLFPVPKASYLAKAALGIGLTGVGVWVYEQVNCSHLLHLGFPYFHSLWHVLAGTAIHFALLFCQFCDAHKLQLQPEIRWAAGLYPYLFIQAHRPSPRSEKSSHQA